MTFDFQFVKVSIATEKHTKYSTKRMVISIKPFMKLRGRIVEKYVTQSRFAEFLGVTEQTVTMKLNGKVQFSTDDIITWSNALDISVNEIGAYFFAEKLSIS